MDEKKKHNNLFYVFDEDKRNNLLKLSKWLDMKNNIFRYSAKEVEKLDNTTKKD